MPNIFYKHDEKISNIENKLSSRLLYQSTQGIAINVPIDINYQNCKIINCYFSNESNASSSRGSFLFFMLASNFSIYIPIYYSTNSAYIRIDITPNTFRVLECSRSEVRIFSISGIL